MKKQSCPSKCYKEGKTPLKSSVAKVANKRTWCLRKPLPNARGGKRKREKRTIKTRDWVFARYMVCIHVYSKRT